MRNGTGRSRNEELGSRNLRLTGAEAQESRQLKKGAFLS